MRILLVTDNYLPESNPPAIRCSMHAKRWIARGHDVRVVTSFPNFPDGKVFGGYRQTLFKREVIDTVNVLRVPTLIFPNRGIVLRIVDFLSFMVTGFVGALFSGRPDIVLATSPQFFAAISGWLVSRIYRRSFVLEIRDLWPDSIVAMDVMKEGRAIKILRHIEQFLYREADLIVTVTSSSRDLLIERGIDGGKIVVVTNGIDTEQFAPGPAPLDLRRRFGLENKTVVTYVGTVGMAHGLQLILDAAQDCRNRLPEVHFLIVGSGAELNDLQGQVRERDLRNVTFVGRVAHDEILGYWQLSDVTLVLLKDIPLFRTVIPSKVFEAMATGTPVISNVRGELQALLEPTGAAVIIEPSNLNALVDAIEMLVRDPERRRELSDAGVKAAVGFDRNKLADKLLDALLAVSEKRAKVR